MARKQRFLARFAILAFAHVLMLYFDQDFYENSCRFDKGDARQAPPDPSCQLARILKKKSKSKYTG